MKSVIVASCKRVKGKVVRQIRKRQNRKKQTIRLADGAEVVVWGVGALEQEANKYQERFIRPQAEQYKTNIRQESSLAVKTQTRDFVLESLLQSGEYTFDHMFVIRNPFGESPLAAYALFETQKACQVRVTTKGKTKDTDYVAVLPATKKHRVPILGLYADYVNQVVIELLDDCNKTMTSHTISIETKGLPSDLVDCVTVKKKAKDPAFPFIMINGGVDIHTCVFDKEGDIRFYLRRKPRGYGIFPLEKGHFFYMEKDVGTPSFSNPQTVQSHDMDYLGRVFKTYHTTNGVHHTTEEKQGGNIFCASNSMREHTEDMVIEIDRKTGEIVWSLYIEDLFDDTYKDMMDWCHVNSAAYYPKDNSVIVSLRNIHSVICVDYTTKKLRWLLSDPEFWAGTSMTKYLLKPVGEVSWVYQQHAAYEVQEDFDGNPDTKHIMVYDNHWHKRRPAKSFDGDPLTYVSFYDVNEKDMTVSLFKRFASPKTRIRANGVYVGDKGRVYNMAGSYAEPVDGDGGGVFEYDFETGEVLSEYGIKPGYFRGYGFEPDMEELCQPIESCQEYFVGSLRQPKKMERDDYKEVMEKKALHVKDTAIDYCLHEDILLVRSRDHQLKKIYLFGDKEKYEVDYDDTYQTMEIFSKMTYWHTAQMDNLPADRYALYLKVNDELLKTGKYIEKLNKE